jgi:DNA repair exonuclease SbcCD nuclease subunit
MRFIHTADWQLGKPFASFPAETRSVLDHARFEAIDAIGRAATAHGAAHVLVAGDVFDTEHPAERTIGQAVQAMAAHPCHWWLLPGNHDSARNGGLWDRVDRWSGRFAQARITCLLEAVPHELEPGAWLLPAPLLHRHNLDDPTEAFDRMETPAGALRIGLAHGSIRDFGSRGEANNLLPPDRARRSALDYLALGDWHGALQVDERTWYAGTPEPDRFERDDPGQCLAVTLSPGAPPQVERVRTGRFQWLQRDWRVDSAADLLAETARLLAAADPGNALLRLTLSGMVTMADRLAIRDALVDDLAHRLRHLDLREGGLVASPTPEDLATLQREGMLGRAAALLHERIEGGGSDAPLARRALERLFVEAARAGDKQ